VWCVEHSVIISTENVTFRIKADSQRDNTNTIKSLNEVLNRRKSKQQFTVPSLHIDFTPRLAHILQHKLTRQFLEDV
ncbi:hypothetical protein, partial [Enterobacter hormaechei]